MIVPEWVVGLVASAIVGALGWAVVVGRRAQRQDHDGAVASDASRAVQRHEVTDATMSQTITTIARGVERMEARLDRLAEGHAESREARVRTDAEVAALRESDVRTEARLDAIDARITRVDEAQTAARHEMRAEMQRWVSTGIGDALEILRALVSAATAATAAPKGGDDARTRPTRRG